MRIKSFVSIFLIAFMLSTVFAQPPAVSNQSLEDLNETLEEYSGNTESEFSTVIDTFNLGNHAGNKITVVRNSVCLDEYPALTTVQTGSLVLAQSNPAVHYETTPGNESSRLLLDKPLSASEYLTIFSEHVMLKYPDIHLIQYKIIDIKPYDFVLCSFEVSHSPQYKWNASDYLVLLAPHQTKMIVAFTQLE